MRFITILWIFYECIYISSSANILGIFPLPGKSHYFMFQRLMKKLAEIGHNVDVVTHFPEKNPPPRFNQFSLEGSLPIFVNNLSINVFDDFSHVDMIHFMTKICGVDACEATLKTEVLQNAKKKSYDLVITEIFGSDCMLGFGHYFKVPTVSAVASIALPWTGDRIGNPDNPSYIPNYYLSVTSKMSFFDRMKNTAMLLYSKYLYHYFSSKESNRIAREFFGDDLPTLEELALNTSLILVNSHFSINYPRPTVPNFIEVGGLHIEDPKPLNQHLEKIIQTSSKGVIFLTMGSMILTETFDFDKLQSLFDAFAELPYKVLWKANRENFHKDLKIPKNIHFEKWMPQLDILCHKNVKLFVSHGGLMGTQESIYCGVPRLGIPLFADQVNNIEAGERLGLAIKVDYEKITKNVILNAAKELLENPIYTENAKRVSHQFKDRPMKPLDTAVFWIEYVLRHKGAPELRSAGADLPFYKYFLIDVICGFILIAATLLFLLCFVLKLILKCVLGSETPKKKND